MKALHWKVVLSGIWLVLTFSLVAWWFLFAFNLQDLKGVEELARHRRMIFWEGGTLLSAVLMGGSFLMFYIYRDAQRHERMKFFFANFSHDIKTSISRLRLQVELLAENKALEGSKNLERLQADLTRLDLQLENSLLLTHVEDSLMLNEKLRFKSLLESLEIEFDTLRIHWQGDAEIFGDQRAVRSILRNSFENSLRHGQAKNIIVRFQSPQQKMSKSGQLSGSYAPVDNLVEIWIEDDGIGLPVHDGRNWKELGKAILPVKQNQSNGIGLYLSRKLMERMQGQIFFSGIESEGPQGSEGEIKDIKSQVGFRTRLQFRGRIL